MCELNSFQTSQALLPAATKFGQGNVFTGVCDSVHRGVGGFLPQCMLGYPPDQTPLELTPPPRADTPEDQTPPKTRPPLGADPPWYQTPPGPEPPREADASIRSMSGRYASYWNAFLSTQCYRTLRYFSSMMRIRQSMQSIMEFLWAFRQSSLMFYVSLSMH